MNTPICDFIRKYTESDTLRLHMPGHKGEKYTGPEKYDITEIDGADSLYEADGIICESEKNAGSLFGADTFFSTEGSSLCIRAMLCLALLDAKRNGKKPVVFAGRNAHKAFITAAVLLDFEIEWIYGKSETSYLSCIIESEELDIMLKNAKHMPAAVYLTSPDYLGNIADIGGISEVCRKYGVLLLVDNAHGAYLKFLSKSQHPIDLGADMCCDSAHKTLPVLTGGAYLHISKNASQFFKERAKNAMGLFGSTSPSYLILQSLDAANRYIAEGYEERLERFLQKVEALKAKLSANGFYLSGNEPLKITIAPKGYGYTGLEFADELLKRNIVCEFSDPDYIVLMLTPEIGEEGLLKLERAFDEIPVKTPIEAKLPNMPRPERVLSVREAVFCEMEESPVQECCGRILASINISCPPAVSVIVCGERIDETAIECFEYYGIDSCMVVK